MVAATINSRSVKPRAGFAVGPRLNLCTVIPLVFLFTRSYFSGCSRVPGHLLLNSNCRLCPVDRDRLQAGIARSPSSDGQGSLSICLCLESECDHGALARNSSCTGRPGSRNLRLSDGFILAVNQSYRLTILREKAAIRHI